MSKSAKGGGGSGKGGSMFAGVVLGMVLGLAVAGGVAWYILKKNPASFENKEHHEAAKPEAVLPPLAKVAPAPAAVPLAAASAVAEPKQHFEFYKVLTDKQDGSKNTEKSAAKESHAAPVAQTKPAQPAVTSKEIYYVQAGSFPNQDDAEKLKAKLALQGMEASLQTADIPNKGTYHRVRLGPFKGSEETNKVVALLKQNGVANATSIKAQ
jgi:cell division protein FtsN